MHRCRPLASFTSLQLGLEGGVRVSVGGVVRKGLRPFLTWVVIKKLNDEGLLGEVLRGPLFGCFCGRWGLRRALGQGPVRGHR